jgi:hypothetical protein
MENETTKAPQTIVRPGHGNFFAPEIFPQKLDLHRHAIQRERAFDRQRARMNTDDSIETGL